MHIQFIVSFVGMFLALYLFECLKRVRADLKTPFKFPSPTDVTRVDLEAYFQAINKVLEADFKASSFPLKIPFPRSSSWTSHKEAKEIVCGLLKEQGWVVIPTNNPNSIKLDLPRVKALSSIEPT